MRLTRLKLFDLFYRAYHAFPLFYDGITQLLSVGQWEKWQERVFPDITGSSILEIGVGPGKLMLRMAKKGYTVTGIELRSGMAYEARKRAKQAGYDIDILHQSVYHLPFKDSTFDCIVMTFVLAEIADIRKAIEEMRRVLKKGGKIIIIAGGMPKDRNIIAQTLFKIVSIQTSLRLERDNEKYFDEYGFKTTREDFGPFNIVHKIVAVKQ
ncbi:class I SAM-dependent methyltransferase [Candidatus Gottesmanbacteria bacterium]|nr:class I SAM-dependent methyltransferase [Candidatus Gottesmanbacteria bacterium]